jgi:hypothetical protein
VVEVNAKTPCRTRARLSASRPPAILEGDPGLGKTCWRWIGARNARSLPVGRPGPRLRPSCTSRNVPTTTGSKWEAVGAGRALPRSSGAGVHGETSRPPLCNGSFCRAIISCKGRPFAQREQAAARGAANLPRIGANYCPISSRNLCHYFVEATASGRHQSHYGRQGI